MNPKSLYEFPEIYDSLRTPPESTFHRVFETICHHLGRTPECVMDPACGPATWLAHFARRGVAVAGNDISPAMVESAVRKCGPQARELIIGDMRDLQFTRGPFDVTFELSGTCGMLANEDNFRRFLRTVSRHTASGGLLLMTVFFVEREFYRTLPCLVDRWSVDFATGGRAEITYEVLESDWGRGVEKVRRTVRTEGLPADPGLLVDDYPMLCWPESYFFQVMADYPEFSFLEAYKFFEPGMPRFSRGEMHGETTVILRKN